MKIKSFMIINLITTFVLIGSLYFISHTIKNYTEEDLFKFNSYLNLKENSVKIMNLGSSHGMYGIHYSKEGFDKINLARKSQNFFYDLQLLKKYSKKLNKDVIVIVPISIFSFYNHNEEKIIQCYIQLLNRNDISKINHIKYFLIKNFSVLYPPNNILKLKQIGKNKENQIKYPSDLKLESKIEESQETALRHLGISDKNYSIKNAEDDFINLIDYIESKNWNYVLITTPFSYLYNKNIEKYQKGAFKERIYDNIKEVEEKLGKKFVYLDYSHDSRFENNLEYFFDDDHLNEKGAKYFTEILLEDLKKLEYKID